MKEISQEIEGEVKGVGPLPSPSGFEDFFTGNYDRFHRFASMRGLDHHSAEDVVHQVFLEVLRRWDQVSSADQPMAYAYAILKMRIVDSHRERSRRAARELAMSDIPEPSVPATESTQAIAHREVLNDALVSLPERQRETVLLYYVMGYSGREVAELLGVSEATVSGHLLRARRSLARILRLPAIR
ncbi:hypothetical protein GCM10010302_09860 [Streptomyces polychromogenes]|uniref:RNA polymerase sigma-70 factor (ECF subfamily) n=1 Tax=Streptomyces polychromogenes TaxID=67342 RepID=A0ABP3ETW1_9ACTN